MKDDITLINEVLEKIPNKYLAVMVASKRAREINRGVRPLVKSDAKKPTTLSLEEVAEDLIVPGPPKPEAVVVESTKRELLPSSELLKIEDKDEEE